MNIYPPFWDSRITVYNKYQDPVSQVIKWYKTVLERCFWKHTRDTVSVGEEVLGTDYIICRVPKNSKFIEKYQWVKVPNDQMPDYFTFGVGDIVVRGNTEDDIDEYVAGKRSTDFIGKYKAQGCFQIEQVEINTGIGRGCEHYFVKGI